MRELRLRRLADCRAALAWARPLALRKGLAPCARPHELAALCFSAWTLLQRPLEAPKPRAAPCRALQPRLSERRSLAVRVWGGFSGRAQSARGPGQPAKPPAAASPAWGPHLSGFFLGFSPQAPQAKATKPRAAAPGGGLFLCRALLSWRAVAKASAARAAMSRRALQRIFRETRRAQIELGRPSSRGGHCCERPSSRSDRCFWLFLLVCEVLVWHREPGVAAAVPPSLAEERQGNARGPRAANPEAQRVERTGPLNEMDGSREAGPLRLRNRVSAQIESTSTLRFDLSDTQSTSFKH